MSLWANLIYGSKDPACQQLPYIDYPKNTDNNQSTPSPWLPEAADGNTVDTAAPVGGRTELVPIPINQEEENTDGNQSPSAWLPEAVDSNTLEITAHAGGRT